MSRHGGDARVAEAIAFMRAHLAEPLTVGDVASQVEFSVSRLSHLFREQTGMAPMEMLREIRVKQGAELLATTDWPVKRIAKEVGMGADLFHPAGADRDDPAPSTFGRLFKTWSGGITPLEWRRMTRWERAENVADGPTKPRPSEPKF